MCDLPGGDRGGLRFVRLHGRVLFDRASERYRALKEGVKEPLPGGLLGSIVMVEPVREARDRGALVSTRPFDRFTSAGVVWEGDAQAAGSL